VIDPVTFIIVGASAGVEQAQNHFVDYGKARKVTPAIRRHYADAVSGTFIAGAILPSLFKQDPRYFYKGRAARNRGRYMR